MRKQKPEPIQVVIHMPATSLEDRRIQLWSEVAARVAGSSNCVNTTTAARYADVALAEFDKRFGKP